MAFMVFLFALILGAAGGDKDLWKGEGKTWVEMTEFQTSPGKFVKNSENIGLNIYSDIEDGRCAVYVGTRRKTLAAAATEWFVPNSGSPVETTFKVNLAAHDSFISIGVVEKGFETWDSQLLRKNLQYPDTVWYNYKQLRPSLKHAKGDNIWCYDSNGFIRHNSKSVESESPSWGEMVTYASDGKSTRHGETLKHGDRVTVRVDGRELIWTRFGSLHEEGEVLGRITLPEGLGRLAAVVRLYNASACIVCPDKEKVESPLPEVKNPVLRALAEGCCSLPRFIHGGHHIRTDKDRRYASSNNGFNTVRAKWFEHPSGHPVEITFELKKRYDDEDEDNVISIGVVAEGKDHIKQFMAWDGKMGHCKSSWSYESYGAVLYNVNPELLEDGALAFGGAIVPAPTIKDGDRITVRVDGTQLTWNRRNEELARITLSEDVGRLAFAVSLADDYSARIVGRFHR